MVNTTVEFENCKTRNFRVMSLEYIEIMLCSSDAFTIFSNIHQEFEIIRYMHFFIQSCE